MTLEELDERTLELMRTSQQYVLERTDNGSDMGRLWDHGTAEDIFHLFMLGCVRSQTDATIEMSREAAKKFVEDRDKQSSDNLSTEAPSEDKEHITSTDYYWGGCPYCGKSDELLNYPHDNQVMNFLLCNVHHTGWWVGSNWFGDDWSGTPEEWEARWERLNRDFTRVEPIYHEADIIPFE